MLVFEFATPFEICQLLGQRLRAHRLAQLLSQAELAARAGVALGTLRKLETTGQTSTDTLVRVAQALGLTEPLHGLWLPQPAQSIVQMAQVEAAASRQRAPKAVSGRRGGRSSRSQQE